MINKILLACILLTSISAQAANWDGVAKNEDRTVRYYVDTQSIKHIGKYIHVTEWTDYDEAQKYLSNSFKSNISTVRYDCKSTNSTLLAVKLFEEKGMKGKLIGDYKGYNPNNMMLIASDTIAAKIYDYVCHTKIY